MRRLEFIGKVQADSTPELIIPGRDDLILKPDDWPKQLAPVTLSIQVSDNGFPEGFEEIGNGDGLKKLDEGLFRPAVVIPHRKIIGSTVKSDADHPTRGFGQVWRADLRVIATGQEETCWMLRIIGDDNPTQIDLVDEEQLRSKMNLSDGIAVKVTAWEAQAESKLPTPDKIVADWCQAARGIEDEFGTQNALKYLIGEKFLNFLDAAERDADFRAEIPAFVAEIKKIFEQWQLAEFLETARQTEPFDPSLYEDDDDPEIMEMERKDDIRRSAADLMLVEQAKDWLLGEK